MRWTGCIYTEDRLCCLARFLDHKKMAVLCRELDISYKAGYPSLIRYKDCGLDGLTDRDC